MSPITTLTAASATQPTAPCQPPRTLPRSVFLIGAQATGKTELFEALRAEYPGSPAVEEVARKVMKEKGWTGADTGREGRQRVLFERSVEAKTEAARGEGVEPGFADDGVRGMVDVEGWEEVRVTYREVLAEVGIKYRVLGKECRGLWERVEWVRRELGLGSA